MWTSFTCCNDLQTFLLPCFHSFCRHNKLFYLSCTKNDTFWICFQRSFDKKPQLSEFHFYSRLLKNWYQYWWFVVRGLYPQFVTTSCTRKYGQGFPSIKLKIWGKKIICLMFWRRQFILISIVFTLQVVYW